MTYNFEKAHPLGTVWVHSKHDIAYVNIPKCGSTVLKVELRKLGFKEQVGGYKPHWRVFAVLRDPLDRLVSGVAEFAWSNGLDHIKTAKSAALTIRAGTWEPMDEHTTPQHVFITMPIDVPIPLERMSVGVPRLLRDWGIPGVEPIGKRRVTDPEYKKPIYEILEPAWDQQPVDDLLHRMALATFTA